MGGARAIGIIAPLQRAYSYICVYSGAWGTWLFRPRDSRAKALAGQQLPSWLEIGTLYRDMVPLTCGIQAGRLRLSWLVNMTRASTKQTVPSSCSSPHPWMGAKESEEENITRPGRGRLRTLCETVLHVEYIDECSSPLRFPLPTCSYSCSTPRYPLRPRPPSPFIIKIRHPGIRLLIVASGNIDRHTTAPSSFWKLSISPPIATGEVRKQRSTATDGQQIHPILSCPILSHPILTSLPRGHRTAAVGSRSSILPLLPPLPLPLRAPLLY